MPADAKTYRIEAVELPMPLDDLIKVGMLADIDGHGSGMTIDGISVTMQPRRDPAAEGGEVDADFDEAGEPEVLNSTAAQVLAIEAAMLPYAVFGLSHDGERAGWCYGRQVRRVYEKGAEHEG